MRGNQFADATDDHQYIHVDAERAKLTPFGGTIAHGYLTLSLVALGQIELQGSEKPSMIAEALVRLYK